MCCKNLIHSFIQVELNKNIENSVNYVAWIGPYLLLKLSISGLKFTSTQSINTNCGMWMEIYSLLLNLVTNFKDDIKCRFNHSIYT